jgi:hypothetical protein
MLLGRIVAIGPGGERAKDAMRKQVAEERTAAKAKKKA